MSFQLASVLSPIDLPEAELCAARLDGELFKVDECFCPIDQVEQSTHRALALCSLLPDRLIAEQRTAAWIMGLLDTVPEQHQFCAAIGARARPANPRRLAIREVVITDADIITIAGLRVTSPLRTAVDITRSARVFDLEDQRLAIGLLLLGRATIDDGRALLNQRRNLPGKRRALERLGMLESLSALERPSIPERPVLDDKTPLPVATRLLKAS